MIPDLLARREALARKLAEPRPDPAPPPVSPDISTASTAHYENLVADELDRMRIRRDAKRRLDTEGQVGVALPPLESLRVRLARPRPPQQWRIHGWQPAGSRVMLTAQYKAGKTTLVANLVRGLVDGGLFLGRDPIDPIAGTVALIDLEMGVRQQEDWYQAHGIAADDRVLIWPLRGATAALDILDPATRSDIAARLRTAGVQYLILDCLRPLMDALGLDEHRDGGRVLVALDALLAEAGIPDALVVHHMGHTAERSRGDSRFRDWPDVEIRLVRRDDDPASPRFITAFGRDVDQPESQLDYDTHTRHLTISGGSRRDAKLVDALDAIRDVLTSTEVPMSGRAIKAVLDDTEHSRDTVYAALAYGVRMGLLAKQDGPRRSKLYRPSSQCPAVSAQCPPDSVSECPAAYIKPDTRTLGTAAQLGLSDPDTQSTGGFDPQKAFLHRAASAESAYTNKSGTEIEGGAADTRDY